MESKQTQCCACHTSPCIHGTPPCVAVTQPASDSEKASPFHWEAAPAERQRALPWRPLVLWIILWTAVVMSVRRYLGKPKTVDKRFKEGRYEYEYDSDCIQSAKWIPDPSRPWPPDDFEYHAYLAYTLPQSSELLYFFSKGSLSHGRIDFVPAEEGEEDVSYNVTMGYHTADAPGKVKVCRLQEGNGHGVGIFTPGLREPIPDEDKVFFSVKVKLPDAKYHALTTDFLRFGQSFDLWAPLTVFDFVSIKSVNMAIYVGALRTNSAVVSIHGGAVYGTFNATDSLELKATNADIAGGIYLTHSGEVDVANLIVSATNGVISLGINLCTPTNSNHIGRYSVASTNSRFYNSLRFWDAPVDSILNVTSVTIMETPNIMQSDVRLHKTFEGTFTLRSAPWHPPVVYEPTEKVEDPAGKGRERHVTFSKTLPGIVKGSVSWIGKDEDRAEKEVGNVNVMIPSPFGRAELFL